jgi:AraC-like DNA-binding protein
VTGSFLVNTADIGEAEHILSNAFASVHLGAVSNGAPTRSRIWRTPIGALVLDQTEYTFDLSYDMAPPDQILLCRMRSGSLVEHGRPHGTVTATTGETIALASGAGLPVAGVVYNARYDVIAFDRRLLNDVASASCGDREIPVQLTASTPGSTAANQRMVDVIDHVRFGVVANADAVDEPLVAGYLSRYVAACILSAFPNNAAREPSIQDRNTATPTGLRRAVAFIDENAHTDVSLADIAAAVRLTPQAVILTFRRHLATTPIAYLRRVRLHQAHLSLLDGDPNTTTVDRVAHRWGFANTRRFAVLYRRAHGTSPHDTLRG